MVVVTQVIRSPIFNKRVNWLFNYKINRTSDLDSKIDSENQHNFGESWLTFLYR